MREYIILDTSGAKHATIKSQSRLGAATKYIGGKSINALANIVVIAESELELFKRNIQKL